MKLATHIITGFLAAFDTYLFLVPRPGPEDLLAASLLGLLGSAVNAVIDFLGHGRRGWIVYRSWTHSVVGVLVATLPAVLAARLALRLLGLWVPWSLLTAALLASALTHLLLDAFTEKGLPLLWPFSRRRYALAHLDYDNLSANLLAIIAYTLPLIKPLGQVIAWLGLYAR